jgi:hypothetical protein
MCVFTENNLYGWEDCPEPVRDTVNDIVGFYRQLLGSDLTGFYLHGSLAMNCFEPVSSDVDFLAVVRRKLNIAEKRSIIDYLLTISSIRAEMSIVTGETVKNMEYPTPFELHYSHEHRDRYEDGTFDWSAKQYDEDLALHFEVVRRRGICLYGKAIENVFARIPEEVCLASVARELDWINERLDTLPATYTVLNSCRAVAFLREDKFFSKKEGGEWALIHMPVDFIDTIKHALAVYTCSKDTRYHSRKMLHDITNYAQEEIARYYSNRNPRESKEVVDERKR